MARPIRIYTLNIGMQTVSMAEFHTLPDGGLKIAAFKTSEHISDPAADATRPIQIEAIVKELSGSLKVKPGTHANVCLTSQEIFSRIVKLPGANPEDVNSIIAFEAQQNVPFPIDEVVWDYQIMGGSRNDSWDVALVAMKADRLSEVVGSVKTGGILADNVEVAPVSLYNAFCYNYPEVTACSLIIDLGARTTNLIFNEEGRMYSRSIPIGGSTVTNAIAKEFNQDFTAAEKLKMEKGSVGLGGAYAEPEDPTAARLAKVIRNTMTRLHAEISRSINYYRTSQGGTAPKHIFLCGGNASLPYALEFFSEKLQTQVEFFDPLRNIASDKGVISEGIFTCAAGIGELVGSATRCLKNCPLEINLKPESAINEQKMARRRPLLVLAGILILLTPLSWWLYYSTTTNIINDKAAQFQRKNKELTDIAAKIEAGLAEQSKIQKEAEPLLRVPSERAAWTGILEELADKLPLRFIWITHLKPVVSTLPIPEEQTKNQKPNTPPPQPINAITAIEVDGLYLDNPPNDKEARIIDEYYENLKQSPNLLLGEDKSKVITQRTTPTGENWAYNYTLIIPLKEPIVLP